MNLIIGYPKIALGTCKDLTGKRFGKLVCLYRTTTKTTSDKSACWVCRCDCGNITTATINNLTSGHQTSCGCQNRALAAQRLHIFNLNNKKYEVQPGDRFGQLTVIRSLGLQAEHGKLNRHKKEEFILCQCSCGNNITVTKASLVSGRTKSCGCLHSWGEACIKKTFDLNHINYVHEYSFLDLKNPKTGRLLRFDYAIFNADNQLLGLLEVDGRQHFTGPEAGWTKSDSLEELMYRDSLKTDYAKAHGIPLIRLTTTQAANFTIDELYVMLNIVL